MGFLKNLIEIFSGKMLSEIHENKEKIMSLKEDFNQFVADVNTRTNEIGAALTEIQADIERLIAANTNTPAEVLAGMEAIKAKLGELSATSTAIAALDNPVETPPEEPL
jgi:methyl-accepting chemotaxis protein